MLGNTVSELVFVVFLLIYRYKPQDKIQWHSEREMREEGE